MNQVIDEVPAQSPDQSPNKHGFRQYESRLASMLQATVEEVLHRGGHDARRSEVPHPASVLSDHLAAGFDVGDCRVPNEPPAGLLERLEGDLKGIWTGVKLIAQTLVAKAGGDEALVQRYRDELQYSNLDPAWFEALSIYIEHFGVDRDQIPYIRHQQLDDFVLPILPDDATIGLIGDWGCGTERAEAVLRELASHQLDALVHLGDIYYGGTPSECERNFLAIVDRVFDRPNNPIPVYTLAGNHDMYAGGCGYYGLLPRLNPAPDYAAGLGQPASYFCLRTRSHNWQLLAMDTGLNDHDPFSVKTVLTGIEASEEAWHVDKIHRFGAGGGRTILLSHHQAFSAFDVIGEGKAKPAGEDAANPRLLASFRKFVAATTDTHDIAAWFWGHEHNMCVYEPTLGVHKGRCIGHGAIPVLANHDAYATVEGLQNAPTLVEDPRHHGRQLRLDHDGSVYSNGFVVLRLRGRTAEARYYQDSDWTTPMFVEQL